MFVNNERRNNFFQLHLASAIFTAQRLPDLSQTSRQTSRKCYPIPVPSDTISSVSAALLWHHKRETARCLRPLAYRQQAESFAFSDEVWTEPERCS
jgi:hypothetical protein